MADRRYKNRVWFVLGTMAIVVVILLVAYNARFLSIGGMGLFGLLVAAKLIMNYSDARTGKYEPLERYLHGLPVGQEDVTLAFTLIEQILNMSLPASASTLPTSPSNSQRH
jgi:hypothetical protein